MLEAYHPETGQQAKNARLPAAWIFKPLMSEMGQTEKNSLRAYVFRFATELGHCPMQSARLKSANRVGLAMSALLPPYP
jgi:hypothetical protein